MSCVGVAGKTRSNHYQCPTLPVGQISNDGVAGIALWLWARYLAVFHHLHAAVTLPNNLDEVSDTRTPC